MTRENENIHAGLKLPVVARLSALAFLLIISAAAASAGTNLEEKMKYERALEQKVEDVLSNLLGPGKSRVMIQATVDFSSKENIAIGNESSPEDAFLWQNINKTPSTKALLPGFIVDAKETRQPAGQYQRETVFPPVIIKRLTVSLVLSEDIAEKDAQKINKIVTELLALDIARGDALLMMRARFIPIWYTSEIFGTLIKYGIIALIVLVGMGIVSMGFLRMASAMRTMAGPEATKISMEMSATGEGKEEDTLSSPEPGEFRASAGSARGSAPAEAGSPEEIVFNIKADKLEILVRLLAKDNPADISLIAVHLPIDLRSKFISLMPPETAAEVLANMVKVRFVEPELIARIKSELESRLSGAVGGYEKAAEMIGKVSLKSQKALLKVLQSKHPDIAARVRTRILLLDDFEHFEDKDFAILAAAVPVELWARAAWRISGELRARLKGHLTERAWQMLEQTMGYSTPADKIIDDSAAEVVATAWKLIGEGRIKKPESKATAIGFNPAAAPEN